MSAMCSAGTSPDSSVPYRPAGHAGTGTYLPAFDASPVGDALVVIFLRGAADGLNMVVPHGENAYYHLRPTLGMARPDDARAGEGRRVVDLDGFFGLHPELAPLLGAWDSGNLAIVHACGAPDESRSHFKAMDLVERGVDNESGPASGWLGRHLGTCDTGNHSPLRALAFGERAPRSLLGPAPVLALRSVEDIGMCDDVRATELMRRSLASMYVSDDGLGRIGRETLEMLDVLDRLDPRGYQPRGGATYPETDFGRGLREIALLTKADVGLEVATLDLGGWDTHFAQGVVTGQMPRLMRELAQALSAFHTDMSSHLGKVSVVVMTEFGRRAYENASLGTDHGHGGLMLLMGGNVAGGRVHGDWPGLDGRLVGPGDLAITTDYRDVLAEVLSKRRHCDAYGEIFPDYTPTMRGVVTS